MYACYGYRRIDVLLKRERWAVNIKRVRRLYDLEGLKMRLKPPRRRVTEKLRPDRSNATGPNQVRAMDWMYGELFNVRPLRVLTEIDAWSRYCPVMRVCRAVTVMEVIDALEEAEPRIGPPQVVQIDRGCQFASKELDLWACCRGVTLDFSRPGTPKDNAFAESFNASVRMGCLGQHWSMNLDDAREKVENWRNE